MVSSLLCRDTVVRTEVQHTIEKVVAISAEALPSREHSRALWELLSQLVVWASWELKLQERHNLHSNQRTRTSDRPARLAQAGEG